METHFVTVVEMSYSCCLFDVIFVDDELWLFLAGQAAHARAVTDASKRRSVRFAATSEAKQRELSTVCSIACIATHSAVLYDSTRQFHDTISSK